MAKHIGHFPLSGRLGSVVFRKGADGTVTVGNYNPVSAGRLKKGKEFKRTRENFTEFSAARMTVRDLTMGLSEIYPAMHTRRTSNQLYSRLVKTIRSGPGIRGQRTLEILPKAINMVNFNFVDTDPFVSKFGMPITYTVTPGREVVTWTIPGFNANNNLRSPQNSTHFEFILGISVLSDYGFSATDQQYQAINPGINTQTVIVRSGLIPVNAVLATSTVLTATLPGLIMPATAG